MNMVQQPKPEALKKKVIQTKLKFLKPRIKPIKGLYLPDLFSKDKLPLHHIQKLRRLQKRKSDQSSNQAYSGPVSADDICSFLKNQPKTKKGRSKKSIEERLAQYKKDFPWLYRENAKSFCFYCQKLCEAEGISTLEHMKDKTFIFIGSPQFKKDAFNKHSARELHCKAALRFGTQDEKLNAEIKLSATLQQDIKKSFELSSLKEEDIPLLPIFRSIYFAAKHNMNLSDIERICSFLAFNDVKIHHRYRSPSTLKEMLYFVAAQVQADHLKGLENCQAIGLQIDESIDIQSLKILTLNIKYFSEGKTHNKFLCLRQITKGDSETVFLCIKAVLLRFGLYHKVKSLATDGAKAFLSDKNGVYAKLSKDLPGLVGLHCIAHRLNLGVSEGWKSDTHLKELNSMVYTLCKLFRKAPSKLQILKDCEMEHLGYCESLIRPLDIRWLTKYSAVERVLRLYPFLMIALTKIEKRDKKDKTASGLLSDLKELKTIGHMKILVDLYDIIKPLNNIFQDDSISVQDLRVSYNIAIERLTQLTINNNYGPLFESFLRKMESNGGRYCGIKLCYKPGDFRFIRKRSQDLAKLILFNLESRFKELNVLEKFDVLRFERLKTLSSNPGDFNAYGRQEISDLSERFKINPVNALKDWNKLKIYKNTVKTIKEDEFWTRVLSSSEFKEIHILIETSLTIPLSTVACERLFSQVSLIKTSLRSNLSLETLDALLEIRIKGPTLEEYNFKDVIDEWKSAKKRIFI